MRLSFVAIGILVALAGTAPAQTNPFYLLQPLSQVKNFLQLTDAQLSAILANNLEYNLWSAQKQSRIRQVQSELVQVTAADPLDPYAIGIRYAEIEAICRQFKEQSATYQKKNVAVLTDPQQARLKILEDALKLLPVISEAQSGNLLGASNPAPLSFASSSLGIGTSFITGTSVLTGMLGGVSACQQPVAAIRTGDFSPLPPVVPGN